MQIWTTGQCSLRNSRCSLRISRVPPAATNSKCVWEPPTPPYPLKNLHRHTLSVAWAITLVSQINHFNATEWSHVNLLSPPVVTAYCATQVLLNCQLVLWNNIADTWNKSQRSDKDTSIWFICTAFDFRGNINSDECTFYIFGQI